ncbi:MAG TPA: CHAT domain-containing tetratricopeptide repeat protein [Thermoanaerobaculia bacterium]|nr:CHAT domain-containing tetratricopeptide repeat protein [Thermoanaerobaculia bacterium]
MTLRRWLIVIGCALLAVPGTAQTNSCIEDISARLEARLKALPDRWDKIPPPLVPLSGRSPEEVLATASEEEQALVSEWITFLALSPPAGRAALISRELQARPLSEVDVWLPEKFTDELRAKSLEEPTLYVEAWLEWAEALGRKDALLVAAGLGLERSALRAESGRLLEIASRWASLPSPDYATRGRAEVLSQYGVRLFAAGESDKALDAYGRARKLFEQAGDRRGRGNTFKGEADVLSVLGDSEKAIAGYKRARELFEQAVDRRGQGNTFNGEASVLLVIGDKQKALDACKRARQLFADAGDRLGQGNTFKVEADVLFRLGDNEKALDAYKRARKLFEDVGDRRGQGDTFYGEAGILSQLGDNEKALDTYQHAHKLYEATGHLLGEGLAFFREADVLYFMSDYDKALAAYDSARRLFEHIGYRWGLGNMSIDEAYIDILLEEHEKALDAYKRARKLFGEVRSRQEEGDTWVGEGEVLFRLGESKKALDAYQRAHELFEQLGDRRGQGNTFKGEADVLAQMGKTEKALDAYRSARKLFEQVELTLGVGGALLGEARLQSRQGNKNEAKNLASQAIAAYRKAGSVDDERSAWLVVAEAEYSSGKLEPAVSAAREAVHLHEAWRFKKITEVLRADEDESISAAYDILVPVLWSRARIEQALAAAEDARSHVLLDLLAAGFKHSKPVALDLRGERQRLVSELAQIETESRQAADAGRLAELQRHRNQIDRVLDWNRYQTLAAEQDALLTAQPLDVAGIRAVARETGSILLYYAADKELIGFLVPSDGTDVFAARIDLSRSRLTEAVQRYIHDEGNPIYAERAAQQSRELWDRLIAPFAARLSAEGPAGRPLVIVPHGPLHDLPFETFLDPAGTPLFERWAVSFAPSVSTLFHARERHKEPQPKDPFLAFSSGRGLKLTDAETSEVATLFGNNKAAFKPTEARFENYESLVPGARQLLISTTGTWVPGDQRKTYLEILPTQDVHDSRLSVAEIAAIPLSAELVALAACDTARGETLLSDERVDLTRAFLIAGAASVLATRWKIPDELATSRFLLDFYRAYRQGGPGGKGLRKDQALTEARRRSRERGDPAQVWAAWVLVGDAR